MDEAKSPPVCGLFTFALSQPNEKIEDKKFPCLRKTIFARAACC
jgi:hypothetical protein